LVDNAVPEPGNSVQIRSGPATVSVRKLRAQVRLPELGPHFQTHVLRGRDDAKRNATALSSGKITNAPPLAGGILFFSKKAQPCD